MQKRDKAGGGGIKRLKQRRWRGKDWVKSVIVEKACRESEKDYGRKSLSSIFDWGFCFNKVKTKQRKIAGKMKSAKASIKQN